MIVDILTFLGFIGLAWWMALQMKINHVLTNRVEALEKEQARLEKSVGHIIDEQIEQMHSK